MAKYSALILSAALALSDAAAAQPNGLDLNLSCPGMYADVESSRATVSGDNGPTTATVNTAVRRTGVAHITLQDQAGEITYPDGRKRSLSNVVASERSITAEYVRSLLLIKYTWRVEIDRITGTVRVANNFRQVAFAGSCTAATTAPKF